MALKTFNINPDVYDGFSKFCKSIGVSMSKQVEMFMASQIEEDPEVRETYLEKLDKISAGKFVKVKSIADRYGLKK